ncbi:MAG: hypothetical protein M3O85_00795, partial [Acidobacteriota bacterium]|nr:hypothetical protein [Acidobacteriota bacterium]
VTAGGKNIYPEDIENAFEGLAVKEYSVFAANYIWAERGLGGEQLVIVLHLEGAAEVSDALRADLATRNRRLPDFKRIHGYLLWPQDFPLTASLKIKRHELAEAIRCERQRADSVIPL